MVQHCVVELTARLRAWTHHRLGLGRETQDALTLLRELVGVYSAHPSGPLTMLARLEGLDQAQFQRLENEKLAVRVPGMRGSVFLTAAEDAPLVFGARPESPADKRRRLAGAGVTEEDYAALVPRALEVMSRPMKTGAINAALGLTGQQWIAVRQMARDGLVVRVGIGSGLRSDALGWVSTAAWLGEPLRQVAQEAALSWLAERYFALFGPARESDFGWWAGVSRGLAARAVAGLDLVTVGDGLLLPRELLGGWEKAEPLDPSRLDVIPKWDLYTMGLAPDGRARFLEEADRPLAYVGAPGYNGLGLPGDGLPLVLLGGLAVGRWEHRFEGQRMVVSAHPFSGKQIPMDSFSGAIERVAAFLNARGVDLR
jgi:hypothetical protein